MPAGSAFCPKCGAKATGAAAAPATTPADKMRAAQAASAASIEPEQQLWHGRYSPKAMYGSWLFAGLITIAGVVASIVMPNIMPLAAGIVVVIWFCLVVVYLWTRLGMDYTLTTQRLVHKSGVLRQVTNRIEVIDIDDVTFEQGLIERMFGVGTIKLLSSDMSDPKLLLRGIDNVQQVATMIDNARREERRRRGLYVESV